MRHLWKGKRKKSPEPPQQSDPFGRPVGISVGSPALQAEQHVILDDEGGGAGPRIMFQDGIDADQELPASGASTPGFAILDAGHGNRPTTKGTNDIEGDIGRTEASRVAKRARRATLLGGEAATERFGPLKVVLGAIPALHANREGIAAVTNRIESLLPRIVTLEERFNSRPSDVADQRHRDELKYKLGVIERRLRLSSGEPSDEDVFRSLQDLQEAVLDYQIAQQKMISDRGFKPIDPAEAAILNNVRYAQQAEYRHGNRSGCLRGTRTEILDQIKLWTRDFDKPPVYWLNGLAGTGKSTIAQTIAERAFADGWLGASFFCSRDFEDRRNLQSIFPTLAVQLARRYTKFRSTFIQLVQSDPEIVHESLYNQMKKLIVQPLVESSISTVIVIDALDECKDEEPASAILSVLGQFVAEVPNIKFFITGRPESRIREGFRLPLVTKSTDVFVLHEVEPGQVDNDIRLFFRHSFSELKTRRHGLDGWPTEEQLDLLCERAGGLFVHAMATVRFIDQRNSCPKKQLDCLLQPQSGSVYEGRTKLKASTTLDSLYTSILQEAFGDDDPENDSRIRSVLGAVVLATNPLSPSTIAALLGFGSGEVFPILSSIHSLLVLQEDIDQPVRPFHKSFPDFIVDPARCASPRFRVHPPDHHAELLLGCLETMNRELEQNMCKLPDGLINSDVTDLRERTNKRIGQALEYACRSWHKHLVRTIPAHIVPILRRFLKEKFLFWLEVLSVLGAAKEAVHALEATAKCEWEEDQAPSALDLVRDYSRFVITFFEVISLSAPHIYHSALPLSPQTSIIRELYKQYARPMARVVRGLPSSWDPTTATFYNETGIYKAVWSPCNRVIATDNRKSVVILDAATLSQLNTFAIPSSHLNSEYRQLSLSPDGHCLTLIGGKELVSWDLQTGGPLGAIPSGLERGSYSTAFSSYSEDGKVVAVAYSNENSLDCGTFDRYDTFIHTYDLSGTEAGPHFAPKGRIIEPIWTRGKFIRFVTLKPGSVAVSEVEFTLKNPPVEVESLPISDKIVGGQGFLFLPSLSRLAFSIGSTIQVWDAKAAKLLLESELPYFFDPDPPLGSFSSDGRFFVHADEKGVTRVWKESPAGYVLHQNLSSPAFGPDHTHLRPCLSPSGESIFISPNLRAYHLWHTRDQVLSLPSVSKSFTLAFSPDESFVAFARRRGNLVTIFNPFTGDLQSAVDTNVGVVCLGMTGSALIAVGEETIVSWDLPSGDCAFNANINDSVRTTILHRSRPWKFTGRCASISPDFSRIALLSWSGDRGHLQIFDMPTWRCLTSAKACNHFWVGFNRDGREVWTVSSYSEGWKIVEDSGSGSIQLELQDGIVCPSEVFPWESRRGYEVTGDGWVLSATRKRLLWLPHRWRSKRKHRVWSGRFLGLLHKELSEVVILQFPE